VNAPLRYGIIGSGMMGLEHMLNVRLFDDARVTAIADPFEASRENGRKLAPEAEIYADYRELLVRAPVDAVVISTPNHTPLDVLADVFQTDFHVLVEKTLCTTVEDCRKVVAAADARFGRVDALVNAAALTDRGTIWDTSPELWDRILNVNLRGPFFLMQ